MTRCLHTPERVNQPACLVENKGGTVNTDHVFAVHFFRFHDPECLMRDLLRIAEQQEVKSLLFNKFMMRLETIPADPDDLSVLSFKVPLQRPKLERLLRSARSVVFGIEEQNQLFTPGSEI